MQSRSQKCTINSILKCLNVPFSNASDNRTLIIVAPITTVTPLRITSLNHTPIQSNQSITVKSESRDLIRLPRKQSVYSVARSWWETGWLKSQTDHRNNPSSQTVVIGFCIENKIKIKRSISSIEDDSAAQLPLDPAGILE